jgi:hypothetical protein
MTYFHSTNTSVYIHQVCFSRSDLWYLLSTSSFSAFAWFLFPFSFFFFLYALILTCSVPDW